MKSAPFTIPLLALSLLAASGCARQQTASNESDSLLSVSEGEAMVHDAAPAEPAPGASQASKPATPSHTPSKPRATGPHLPAGTALVVKLGSVVSSKTAQVGDTWSGTISEPVSVDGKVVIPAGTTVTGTVTGAKPAKKGDRAMLELAVKSVGGGAHSTSLTATTEPVIAGSTRARNLGAIAGGAAAGALIGKAVGGDGKDAAIGAVIGGAAATGAVAASQGYQVELKEGTALTFTTTNSVALR